MGYFDLKARVYQYLNKVISVETLELLQQFPQEDPRAICKILDELESNKKIIFDNTNIKKKIFKISINLLKTRIISMQSKQYNIADNSDLATEDGPQKRAIAMAKYDAFDDVIKILDGVQK